MRPILIEWGPFLVPSWHAFFAIGAILGYLVLSWLTPKCDPSIDDRQIGQFFLINYICGYFGARFTSILIEQHQQISTISELFTQLFALGPMTFYGGLIGGLGGSICWFVATNRNPRALVDAAAPCVMLGLCFGRIGCFLNGDDFGKPVPLDLAGGVPWWAVVFPNLGDQVARYPVQLIESGVALVLFAAGTFLAYSKKLSLGFAGLATISMYAFSRFFLEMLRGDPRGWVIEGLLSPSQFLSMVILMGSVVVAFKWQGLSRSA